VSRELHFVAVLRGGFFPFLVSERLFVVFFNRIVVDAQNVFVFLLDEQLNCFGPFLNQCERLVHVEGIQALLFVDKRL
jgi:hypothetical protein